MHIQLRIHVGVAALFSLLCPVPTSRLTDCSCGTFDTFCGCSISENMIRFSFSHSLTHSLLSLFFFFCLTQPTCFSVATHARLCSPCTCNLFHLLCFNHSDSPTVQLLFFHPTPTLPTPLSSPLFIICPIYCLAKNETTQVKYKYQKVVLQYSNSVNVLSYIPSPPLVSPRGCSVCRHGFCSMTNSGCFSTRRTRTASTNLEPSGASARPPAKCKQPCKPPDPR